MFQVIPYEIERDRIVYQNKDKTVSSGTRVYAIKLDKVNDVEYYFTFSYLNPTTANEIAHKLWQDGREFYQDVNRTYDMQLTLISER